MAAGLKFMIRYPNEGEDLFDHIVTGHEKWVYYFTPEMRSASKLWVLKIDEHPVKASVKDQLERFF